MAKPELLLFDYGGTLVYEPRFDTLAGFSAVLEAALPGHGITAEQLSQAYAAVLARLLEASRAADADLMDMAAKRMLYESLGLSFAVAEPELERIFWDAAGPGMPMPGAPQALARLQERGFRLAVLSNMNFREANLRERLRRYLPGIDFAFVLCSCEYATRKPRRDFFELALRKAGLPADQVWFCGDNPRCDIQGAADSGIFPVWYRDPLLPCPYRSPADEQEPSCAFLPIASLQELADTLLA